MDREKELLSINMETAMVLINIYSNVIYIMTIYKIYIYTNNSIFMHLHFKKYKSYFIFIGD